MAEDSIFDVLRRKSVLLPDEVRRIAPATIAEQVQAAWDCLSARPEEPAMDAPMLRLSSMGKSLKEAAGEEKKHKDQSGQGVAAAVFAASGKPFSLALRTGRDQGGCDILLQAQDMELQCMQAMLSGVYGSAQLQICEPARETRTVIRRHLLCTAAALSDKELEQPVHQEGSWIARMAGALMGENCEVKLSFAPVDQQWIERQISRVITLLDEMASYQKSAIQLSVNDQYSYETKDEKAGLRGIIMQAGRNIRKGITGEEGQFIYRLTGDSQSASRTFEAENHAVEKACEMLKQHLARLDWMRRSGAWSISAWISTDSEAACAVAEKMLNAEFMEAGFRCDKWTPGSASELQRQHKPVSALLPANRLGAFFAFPQDDLPGFRRIPLGEYEINLPLSNPQDMSGPIGRILWNDRELRADFALPRAELNRHAFICGMTGSGKSTTVCTLLKASAQRLPFMVIEPVKGEYRTLKKSVPDLQICTMEVGSPEQLSINPFWFPEGGSLQYHIDSLRAVIASAFELTAAMPNILEQCLTRVYINLGWNVALGTNTFTGKLRPEMLYPTFDMLCREIDNYLDRSDYAEEIKSNYKGAMSARLKSFTSGSKGLLLNQQVVPPFMEWLSESRSCVIELEALADDADKAIVMGVMLSQYYQCVKRWNARTSGGLRHVIVLEEAHHLFRESKDSGNPEGNVSRRHLVEMLSNMLAEIRAYGEGVFIVDQSPTSISAQVIKNTAVKIVHRVDYGEDLKTLQHALLLQERDLHAPAHLECGTALIRYGSMSKPVHVAIRDCEDKREARLGKVAQVESEGLSAQHLIDLVQNDEGQYGQVCLMIMRFVNHLLFDDFAGARRALDIVQEKIEEVFSRYGVDTADIECLTPAARCHMLKTYLHEALTQRYPMQYLLRGKLQMLADRYLELQFGRLDGIRPVEWNALRGYCQHDVYPLMAGSYRYGVNAEEKRLASMFSTGVRGSLAGIVVNMIRRWEEIGKFDDGKIREWSAEEGVRQLCNNDFLCVPAITLDLWRMFKMCCGRRSACGENGQE